MDPHLYQTSYDMDEPSGSTTREIFTRHSDSVLCCSIDYKSKNAVSGGIDDTAFVWNLNTRHVIFECLGHKESVVAAAFNLESNYVATGDLSGYIQVRNTITGIKITDYDIDEVNWLMWHNTSEYVLLAGTTKGDFWMWNVNDPAAVKTFPSYGSPTTGAKLLTDGMRIVTAYGDGSVRLFDLKTKQCIHHINDPTKAEIICMDIIRNCALLVVGCIDSTVKIITLNNCKVVGTLLCKSPEKSIATSDEPGTSGISEMVDSAMVQDDACGSSKIHKEDEELSQIGSSAEPVEVIDDYTSPAPGLIASGEDEMDDEGDMSDNGDESAPVDSVESALFSPCGNFIAASNNSGSIFMWDVATLTTRCELHTGIGITRCSWTDNGNYVTGCLDGIVRVYDRNLNKLEEIKLHSDQILDIAYRNKVLVTVSEDKTCRSIRMTN